MIVDNVKDRRRQLVGSWIAESFDYSKINASYAGRTVIYRDQLRRSDPTKGNAEAGTISSWANGVVFARYTTGDTAAGCFAGDLLLGVRPLDTPDEIFLAKCKEEATA
jgi:hypothetical protein